MPEPDERYPAHPQVTETYEREGAHRVLLMTPVMASIGAVLAFFAVVGLIVVLPVNTYRPEASENWLPLTDEARDGRAIYMANGCVYCHSQFTRPQDVFQQRYYLYPRVSLPGDYYGESQSPQLLGSERTGPDLSQEGGFHPDQWHEAHYHNARFVMPQSWMPIFSYFSEDQLNDMIAYTQAQGGKDAYLRYSAQQIGSGLMKMNCCGWEVERAFPEEIAEVIRSYPDFDDQGDPSDMSPWGMPWGAVYMLNTFERGYWLTTNPLPLTLQNLIDGKHEYLKRCSGCHGVNGNGDGPAAEFFTPKPFPFNSPAEWKKPFVTDGNQYHRILTAGPGTAMESFATRISLEEAWRLVLFLRTIPNGSLEVPVPSLDMYEPWTPEPSLLRYIEDHPITAVTPNYDHEADPDPWLSAATWIQPGLAEDDVVLAAGRLPITLDRLADLIRRNYFRLVEEAWTDAVNRQEEDLPSRELVFNTDHLTWVNPS